MLIGKAYNTLDGKDRLIIPAKFRRDFEVDGEARCVVTLGNEPYLEIHTLSHWEEMAERIAKLPTSREGSLYYKMRLLGEAEHYRIDKQGRFVITQDQKKYANIERECVLFGMIHSLYLWSKEGWERKQSKLEPDFDSLAREWGGVVEGVGREDQET